MDADPSFALFEQPDGERGARLVLRGELDIANMDRLRDHIAEAHARVEALAIDLRELTFIDSSGISVLLRAYDESRGSGRRLTLVPGPPQVQKVFAVTGLLDHLPFEDGRAGDDGKLGRLR